MTKDKFLTIIQSEARRSGSNAARAWDHAQRVSASDKRWQYLKSESECPAELTRQYCQQFGLEYCEPARRKAQSRVELWTKRLAKAEKTRDSVAEDSTVTVEVVEAPAEAYDFVATCRKRNEEIRKKVAAKKAARREGENKK